MSRIERQVHIEAAPIEVAAALARSPWRSALTIEPVGAGTRVSISAVVEPDALAVSIENQMLEQVCHLRTSLAGDSQTRTSKQHKQGAQQRSQSKQKQNQFTQKQRRTTVTKSTTRTTLTRRVTVNAAPSQVWAALADFGGVASWHPGAKAARLTSADQMGEGTTRECELLPLGKVQERITEWVEDELLSVEIFEFKNMPAMRSGHATFNLRPNQFGTEVVMEMSYEVGMGAVGAGMNSMLMKRRFAKLATEVIAGLKHHVETGALVDARTSLPTETVAVT